MKKEVRDSALLTSVIFLTFKLFHKKLNLAYISVFVTNMTKKVKGTITRLETLESSGAQKTSKGHHRNSRILHGTLNHH